MNHQRLDLQIQQAIVADWRDRLQDESAAIRHVLNNLNGPRSLLNAYREDFQKYSNSEADRASLLERTAAVIEDRQGHARDSIRLLNDVEEFFAPDHDFASVDRDLLNNAVENLRRAFESIGRGIGSVAGHHIEDRCRRDF